MSGVFVIYDWRNRRRDGERKIREQKVENTVNINCAVRWFCDGVSEIPADHLDISQRMREQYRSPAWSLSPSDPFCASSTLFFSFSTPVLAS